MSAGVFLPKEEEQKKNPGQIGCDRAREIALYLLECLFRACVGAGESTAVQRTRGEELPLL